MIDKKEILARLSNGEDAQNIANDIAKELNSTIAEHFEKQEQKKTDAAKIQALNSIVKSIIDFIEDFYPDLYDEELREFKDTDLLEIVEKAVEDARKIAKTLNCFDEIISSTTPVNKKTTTKDIDPIEEFLAKYVN